MSHQALCYDPYNFSWFNAGNYIWHKTFCYLDAAKVLKSFFNAIFEFTIEKTIINSAQSGFRPRDSWVDELITITLSTFSSFGANLLLRDCVVFFVCQRLA